ncbi:urea transporter [Paraburkholderia saeva]|uniref:Urea transporter n=1 Tax=Paraburkholderia saeva TaxID=2777537 RepID=A0A9N8S312_9BURK|nr:urea transporter [Paraburkholderia saeva]CAG4926724.1 Urea transporter [Paraburkholderia saeva]
MHATTTPTSFAALRTLLRSLGQIVLQRNAATGACVLAALVICDPRLACAALIGAVSANVSAVLAGHDEQDTRGGLHGFNGALAALAAFTFIADNATAIAIAILAATATAWMLDPWSRLLRRFRLSGYSSPCLLVTWAWLALAGSATHTDTHHVASTANAVSSMDVLHGVLAGVAQTTFAGGVLPGVLVIAGIAASSRRHACWALAGAALATGAHLLSWAPLSSLDTGLLGFNGALTALAVADCGAAETLAAIALSVLLQQLAGHLGWTAMTAPFVLSAWCAHALARLKTRRSRTSRFTVS